MKGILDAYVLWPLAKRVQNQTVVDWSTACDFTVAIFTTLYLYRARSISWSSPFFLYSGAPVNQERWPQRQPQFSCLSWLAKKPKQTNVSAKRNRPQFHNVLSWPFLFWVHQQKTQWGQRLYEVASVLSGILKSKNYKIELLILSFNKIESCWEKWLYKDFGPIGQISS